MPSVSDAVKTRRLICRGPAGTSPRESSHKHSNEEVREECRLLAVPKEEYSVKGVAAEDAKPPTGLKIRKKCSLASRRATPGAQRPPPLTVPNREDKAADAGSTDPEVSLSMPKAVHW